MSKKGRPLLSKEGYSSLSNDGEKMVIINYRNSRDIDIQFEDGAMACNREYKEFKLGTVTHPLKYKKRIGETYTSYQGYIYEIIEYFSSKNCTVILDNKIVVENLTYQEILDGKVTNPYHKSVYGVGYVGKGRFKPYKNGRDTPEYMRWHSMINRCYDQKYQEKQPTYKGCIVDERWHNFQVFAEWFENNHVEDWHLDKDILVKGNKIYSPETCCFVPREINNLFFKSNTRKGNLPIRVKKKSNRFEVQISKDCNRIYIGIFNTPEEAFQAYKTAKEKHIKEVADKWKRQISDKVYQAMYNYQVEITD